MPCYYLPKLTVHDVEYQITGEEHHHISNVLRKSAGDKIKITNGCGILFEADIIDSNRKYTEIRLTNYKKIDQTQPYIALAFALLKNKHDNLIVEKCTELGCREFFPMITDFTIRKAGSNVVDKFNKTAVAAIKQCDNAWLPKVHQCLPIKQTVENIRHAGYEPVVALETEENIHVFHKSDFSDNQGIALIIGPEGGFSEQEKKFFINENIFCFTLGNHILRAETAAIAGVSLLAGLFRSKNPRYY